MPRAPDRLVLCPAHRPHSGTLRAFCCWGPGPAALRCSPFPSAACPYPTSKAQGLPHTLTFQLGLGWAVLGVLGQMQVGEPPVWILRRSLGTCASVRAPLSEHQGSALGPVLCPAGPAGSAWLSGASPRQSQRPQALFIHSRLCLPSTPLPGPPTSVHPVPATHPLIRADRPPLLTAAAVHCTPPALTLPSPDASCFCLCSPRHTQPRAACLCPRPLRRRLQSPWVPVFAVTAVRVPAPALRPPALVIHSLSTILNLPHLLLLGLLPSVRRPCPAPGLLAAAVRAPCPVLLLPAPLCCLRLSSLSCARHSLPLLPRALPLSILTVATLFFLFVVSMVTSLAPLSTRRPRDTPVSRSASRDLPLSSPLSRPPPRPHPPPRQSQACMGLVSS